MTFSEIFWLMLATGITAGAMIILSALVTGYLVFRAKRETHETLFQTKRRLRGKPLIRDEFSTDAEDDDENVLPTVIEKMNQAIGAQMAVDKNKR